ncbi:MAG: MinD/ParA family ATP-binding protein, partial [Stackebrandtia sp.]
AIGHLKSSVGATTAAMAIAATWPLAHTPIVAECDPYGGDLQAAFRLPPTPGLAELAARQVVDNPFSQTGGLAECAQQVTVWGRRVDIIGTPPSPPDITEHLSVLTQAKSRILRPSIGTVIADVGRIYPASPAWPVLDAADAVLIVVPATPAGLAQLRVHADLMFHHFGLRLAVIMRAAPRDATRRLATSTPVDGAAPVIGHLPDNPRAAASLTTPGHHRPHPLFRRTCRHLTQAIRHRLDTIAPDDVDTAPHIAAQAPVPQQGTPQSTMPKGRQ